MGRQIHQHHAGRRTVSHLAVAPRLHLLPGRVSARRASERSPAGWPADRHQGHRQRIRRVQQSDQRGSVYQHEPSLEVDRDVCSLWYVSYQAHPVTYVYLVTRYMRSFGHHPFDAVHSWLTIFCVCVIGFGNFGSLGTQIGVLSQIAPSRAGDVSRVALSALFSGVLSTLTSASIAGLLVTDQSTLSQTTKTG